MDAQQFPPAWSTLREIGSTTAARLSVLVPLLGSVIIFNDQVLGSLTFKLIAGANAAVSSRLIFTYFGLSLISFGSIIYAFNCPDEIKRYSSYTAYVAGIFDLVSIFHRQEMERTLRATIAGSAALDRTLLALDLTPEQLAELQKSFDRGPTAEKMKVRNYYCDLITLYYSHLDQSKVRARFCCFLFYGAGFVTLGLVFLHTFSQVLGVYFRGP